MKITHKNTAISIDKYAQQISVDRVFSGVIHSINSTFLRIRNYVLDLNDPNNMWHIDGLKIENYTPLDAELVIHGEAK